MIFFTSRTDAAQFAGDTIQSLAPNSALTMIITVDELGACSASTVIIGSSEDTGMQRSSDVSRRILKAVQATTSLFLHEEKERRKR